MATLQNPSPSPYPNRSPIPNSNPNPAPAVVKSPSFEEVSKLFSLPLSYAADSLGVCPSVLKKVCYENGLVRWPYRQFLSGKSIEEIKKDAALEKEKKLTELKVTGERHNSFTSLAASPSLGAQPQSTNAGSSQESPALRILTQQPIQIESSYNMQGTNLNKGNSLNNDEFKYGFPSGGLSSVSYRWWGNKSEADNGGSDTQQSKGEETEEIKQPSKDSEHVEMPEGKKEDDNGVNDNQQSKGEETEESKQPPKDSEHVEMTEGKKEDDNGSNDTQQCKGEETEESKQQPNDSELVEMTEGKNEDEKDADLSNWASLHSELRKKAAKEGRQALKLGVHRGYSVKTLDKAKKSILVQIFKSSFPSEWGDISPES